MSDPTIAIAKLTLEHVTRLWFALPQHREGQLPPWEDMPDSTRLAFLDFAEAALDAAKKDNGDG